MTAIANLPGLRPSLLLDFANSGRVDPRIQCTRASSATCFGPDGKLRTVAANVPRIDYDPATGKCLGLLVEEARTNLLPYSEQLENVAWTKFGASITANSEVAPNGTATADKIVENTEGGVTHDIRGSISSSNGTYTFSAYLKAAGRDFCELFMSDGATGQVTVLVNLTLGTSASFTGGSWTGMTSTVTPAGSGWYRVAITATKEAGISVLCRIRLSTSLLPSGTVYTGDGTSGVFAWGVQLEAGSFPTSYTPTEGIAVTRAGEIARTDLGDWFNPREGTAIVDYDFFTTGANSGVIAFSDGTENNRMIIRQAAGRSTIFIGVKDGVPQYNNGFTNATPNTLIKAGFTYKRNRIVIGRNGSAPLIDTEAEIPFVNTLRIGSEATALPLNGHVRRLSYFSTPLDDAQLQRQLAL